MERENYILRLPLQEMVLRKTAIMLWNRFYYDSLPSLCNPEQSSPCFSRRRYNNARQQLLNILVPQVQEKAEIPFLPTPLREKLKQAIVPIVSEVKRWRDYHQPWMTLTETKNIFDQLCWTSIGTVDYRKTAEVLIRQKLLDNISSYELSCIYCFEHDIRMFWGKLPENYVTPFIKEDGFSRNKSRVTLVTFWTYLLKDDAVIKKEYELEPNFSLFQYAFESAALSGNKVATEYFFQKLSIEEREASLTKTAQYVLGNEKQNEIGCVIREPFPQDFPADKGCDVVSYLLSRMKKVDQIEIFKNNPFATLVCFLDWPWQEIFMKVAVHTWSFLADYEYKILLTKIATDNSERAIGHLFGDFFLQAPSGCRHGLYQELFGLKNKGWFAFDWFERLFYVVNAEVCIKIVLRYLTSSDRESLITSKYGLGLCQKLIKDGKCSLLELFIEECTLTDEIKKRLKDRLEKLNKKT